MEGSIDPDMPEAPRKLRVEESKLEHAIGGWLEEGREDEGASGTVEPLVLRLRYGKGWQRH